MRPEREEFLLLIDQASRRVISAVSVLEGRSGSDAGADLDLFLRRASVEILAFDEEQLALARTAFRLSGKGRHGWGLILAIVRRMRWRNGRESHCCLGERIFQ